VVARAIHVLSRRPGAFVPVNVGAIAESLADAELFGHRRGAFTGAVATRAGAFEEADRGTLFLDEVAELSAALQVKLLRVVEDRVVRPIGAAHPIQVDVRFVAATWAELCDRVELGRFREDLYHRLARVVVRLPALRDRKSDIPALSAALLARMEPEVGSKQLSSAALARLVAHTWPGNVRELDSVLYRAAAASEGAAIAPHHVCVSRLSAKGSPVRTLKPSETLSLLDAHAGNITAAARMAGVPRSTFRAWLSRARQAG
jgi:DNA-binding NtrC family response regulator